jgi:hypothetical protein
MFLASADAIGISSKPVELAPEPRFLAGRKPRRAFEVLIYFLLKLEFP